MRGGLARPAPQAYPIPHSRTADAGAARAAPAPPTSCPGVAGPFDPIERAVQRAVADRRQPVRAVALVVCIPLATGDSSG